MAETASTPAKCAYCGSTIGHPSVCPSVKAFEYHPNGTVKRVEFHGPAPIQLPPQPIYYTPPSYPGYWPITSTNVADDGFGVLPSGLVNAAASMIL